MSRIEPILNSKTAAVGRHVSVGMVDRWIGDLRSIPYGFTREWKTPDETQSGQPADCKAKAIALYHLMKAHGATNVRLIIGKRTPSSRSTHAWLDWETEHGSYLLDPTWNWKAYPAREVGRRSYVPYFAFEGSKKFRATITTLLAQN